MSNENSATSSLNQTFTNMNPNNLIAINAATQLPLKLTPTNYYSWKTQFDALLYGYDLLGYIDGTKPCPSPETTVDEKIVPNPVFTLWMRQDKLFLLGIIGSLSHKVVLVTRSCKTSTEAWNRLAKLYANPSSSRIMGLAEQLTLINRGSQPVADYLATTHDITDELALIGAPIPNQYLITHTLNGMGTEFKELAAAVRARDTVISFDELHDKLVEYEAFLKREDLRSSGNLGNMTANAARFPIKNGNQANKKNSIIIMEIKASILLIQAIIKDTTLTITIQATITQPKIPMWFVNFVRNRVILLDNVILLKSCSPTLRPLPPIPPPPIIPHLIGF
ncbi:hypothetical protein AB3S75_013236 [Citrus x aurantiifolia]